MVHCRYSVWYSVTIEVQKQCYGMEKMQVTSLTKTLASSPGVNKSSSHIKRKCVLTCCECSMESRKWTTWEELVVIVIFLLTVKRSVFAVWLQMVGQSKKMGKKVKVAHTRLPRLLAVSLQVTWVINQAVGCHYFPPGLQLPLQPLRGQLPILLLDEQRHNGCEQFA